MTGGVVPRPMREATLVDANIVLFALGDSEPQRSRCRSFLDDVWRGSGSAYVSAEMVQEVVFHRMRRAGRADAVAAARRILPAFVVLDFDHEVLEAALGLIEATDVRGRDAVHAATALVYGIETIASTDPAFDQIPGIRRVDPLAD